MNILTAWIQASVGRKVATIGTAWFNETALPIGSIGTITSEHSISEPVTFEVFFPGLSATFAVPAECLEFIE